MAEIIANIRLLNVNLHNDYKHTIFFNDRSEQQSYFLGVKTYKDLIDYSYQRKDSKLRVNLSFDIALKYNYVMYQNLLHDGKYYYAFITDYEWNNDNCTTLTLQTDVMQTYLLGYEYDYLPSFVEREHTNDDTVGANTIPENLEVGEYTTANPYDVIELSSLRIIVGVTEDIGSSSGYGGRYNNIYSGIIYHAFPNTDEGVAQVNGFLSEYAEDGKSESIQCVFLAPDFIATTLGEEESTVGGISTRVQNSKVVRNMKRSVGSRSTITNLNRSGLDYNLRNNKLRTFPYQYLMLSNNNGGSAIYKYEEFSSDTIEFSIKGAITPGCSIFASPQDYKGVDDNLEEGLPAGKFPICNWSSDQYTNWITQNALNIGINLASGGLQIVGGAIAVAGTGGAGAVLGGGSIVGGISTITNQLAQIHQMSFTPPQSHGNVNCGDVATSAGRNILSFYYMRIKKEYAKVIDDYFTAYGYKTNRVKLPEWLHRERWWYTKTIDINLYNYGTIPTADLNKIKDCFNNGITFWRKASDIGHYEYSNNIV